MQYFVIGVLVLVVVAIAAYYILRFMKGKLELHLSHSSATSGEPIQGSVRVEAKKELHGRLKVSLVCVEEYREYKSNHGDDDEEGDREEVNREEIFRKEHILEKTGTFSPGDPQEYQFEMIVPHASDFTGRGSGSAGRGLVGTMLSMADASGHDRREYHWHVEARLDVKGVDLFAKKRVNVRLAD